MTLPNSNRIAKNVLLLYIRMLLIMIFNLFSVRFVLNALGDVDYGIYNVIAGVVVMLSCVNTVMSTATQRFYSYSIGNNQLRSLRDIFSASMNIYIVFSLIVLLLSETIGLWFVNTQLVIPGDRLMAANWIYQCAIISFIASLIQVPFSAFVFAREKMGIFAIISLISCVLKFLLALSLFVIVFDRLIFYGLLFSIIDIIVLLSYIIIGKRLFSECRYGIVREKRMYKELISFSGWSLLSSFAGAGTTQVNTLLTNVFFGPVVNTARAVGLQVSSAVGSFTSNFIMAIRPPMIKAYAEGAYSRLNRLFYFSNKLVFYCTLLIILPLFFEMDTILWLWLKKSDSQMLLFCRLLLIYAFILVLNNPISIIIQATGKIKEYSSWVEVPTLLCMPVTYFLYKMGLPAESTFYTMIIAIFFSHFIRLVCLKRVYPYFSYKEYVINFFIPAILIAVVTSILAYLILLNISVGFFRFCILFVSTAISLCFLCIVGGLSSDEKKKILSLMQFDKFVKFL